MKSVSDCYVKDFDFEEILVCKIVPYKSCIRFFFYKKHQFVATPSDFLFQNGIC